jgi:hypothetical protein
MYKLGIALFMVATAVACQTPDEPENTGGTTEVVPAAETGFEDKCKGSEACDSVCGTTDDCGATCWKYFDDEAERTRHCEPVTCNNSGLPCQRTGGGPTSGGGAGGGGSVGGSYPPCSEQFDGCRPGPANGKLLGQTATLVIMNHKGQVTRYGALVYSTYARPQTASGEGCVTKRCKCDDVHAAQSSTWVGPSPLPGSNPSLWGSSKVRSWGITGAGECKHY